ncbi:DUF4956 domain-containing protein [Cellulomonas wangsupingiae]|uniref:DUF4956 domain-containing protein n=1 Tax=Cellulomonas wangsupingiae TaxID=2968085 RepID=A0ABY5KB16_9CELL|nr:DUF4956 domain-containing protein [Cellulomonas wangsupingiae]MCC2335216.1 DUF4956 domain-containing protein [Cellulomonas wangsupingiae]MCM0639164.1 DUF4956 domain-containing protein [Cellulomonas wangsupingiae]UUI66641.1 DUF4956 domain-containing protein [Cellulomonas wangsupingiae]
MDQLVLIGTDLVAVGVLTWTYFRRHRRRDLVVAFLGMNVGVLAVASTLASATIGAGLGLGLFGVLSIIRLRSTEVDQREVAYYFAALALGILGALPGEILWHSIAFMALLLLAVLVGDHPRVLRRHQRQELVLDGAVLDRVALVARLEGMLGARVHQVAVQRVDLVNDTTWVDVRYETVPPARRRGHVQAGREAARTTTTGTGS